MLLLLPIAVVLYLPPKSEGGKEEIVSPHTVLMLSYLLLYACTVVVW